MGAGFYIVMLAQFFSALADNALLIAAIFILQQSGIPDQAPLLKFFFTVSYVVLAAFVGAFADSMPKGRVMLISNTIKIVGCCMMLFGVSPLLAYGIVGLGAAAYSPAKYGILTEMLPHSKLVVANSWIEGMTVGAIILGTLLGGMLIRPDLANHILNAGLPLLDANVVTISHVATIIVVVQYIIAAIFNVYVPETGVDHKPLKSNPVFLVHEFAHCVTLLWRDKLGQISLAVTTLFWGAGATLQFLVLKWAEHNLSLHLSAATKLQGIVAVGVTIGSVLAAKFITLKRSVAVIPLGIVMGLLVNTMIFVHETHVAMILMVVVGALSGFFVVPMNALLQHRGHVLMGAGHSIAVQNFNENLSILAMTYLYYLLLRWNLSLNVVIVLFGAFMAGSMYLIKRHHDANQREFNSLSLLEDKPHHH